MGRHPYPSTQGLSNAQSWFVVETGNVSKSCFLLTPEVLTLVSYFHVAIFPKPRRMVLGQEISQRVDICFPSGGNWKFAVASFTKNLWICLFFFFYEGECLAKVICKFTVSFLCHYFCKIVNILWRKSTTTTYYLLPISSSNHRTNNRHSKSTKTCYVLDPIRIYTVKNLKWNVKACLILQNFCNIIKLNKNVQSGLPALIKDILLEIIDSLMISQNSYMCSKYKGKMVLILIWLRLFHNFWCSDFTNSWKIPNLKGELTTMNVMIR